MVEIRDVRDAEAFVGAAVTKLGLALMAGEREELHAEGLLILCELSEQFMPSRRGWSFSSYAGELLPKRLIDAWHRLHRGEHVRRDSGAAGGRRWEYRVIASLDEERERPAFSERNLRLVGQFERSAQESPVALAA